VLHAREHAVTVPCIQAVDQARALVQEISAELRDINTVICEARVQRDDTAATVLSQAVMARLQGTVSTDGDVRGLRGPVCTRL
jgi:hypothetical protein